MGMFGGKKDSKRSGRGSREGEDEGSSRTERLKRRSRRIVVPNQGGGSSAGSSSSGTGRTRRQAPSKPAAQPRPKAASPAPAPAEQEDDLELQTNEDSVIEQDSASDELSLDLDEGMNTPAAGVAEEIEDLDFAGDLDSAGGAGAAGGAGGSYSRTGDRALFNFLTEEREDKGSLVAPEQAQEALAKAESDDVPFDVALTSLGHLSEDEMVNALTQECWVPHLKVDKYEIRKKALDTIKETDARFFSVLPVDKLGGILNLAMVNPLDQDTINALEQKTGLDIKKVVATRSEIDEGIARYYGGQAAAKDNTMSFAQDAESQRITQMLSKVPVEDKTPQASPLVHDTTASQPPEVSDIEDIDEILSADDAIQPSVIEPMELEDGAEEDIDIVQPSGVLEMGDYDEGSKAALEPLGDMKTPYADIEVEEEADEPELLDEPAITKPISRPKPAPEPARRPARPPAPAARREEEVDTGPVDMVPVTEEEFQHAITHGKAHVFERWVGIHSRNRILNAASVDETWAAEMDTLFSQPTVQVEVESAA